MFETCMVESAGQFKSHNRRWSTAGAFLIEGVLLAVGVLTALIHTDVIATTARIVPIIPSYTPVQLITHSAPAGSGGGGTDAFVPPAMIPKFIANGSTSGTHQYGFDAGPHVPGLSPGEIGGNGTGIFIAAPHPSVEHKRLVISSMDPAKLVQMVKPIYPTPAKLIHLSGQVYLHAIIGINGSVQNLEVVRGHPLLAAAALNAVRQWRYKPTILGGQAVEVETTITVNFTAN
jgi:periplasmic protein TonB